VVATLVAAANLSITTSKMLLIIMMLIHKINIKDKGYVQTIYSVFIFMFMLACLRPRKSSIKNEKNSINHSSQYYH